MTFPFPARQAAPVADRSRNVKAVLGPTNTGKTHYAIERMLAHSSGVIGLPLRLLAREVYGRILERVGPDEVSLITGEEKIKPRSPRYWVATVEAMPRDLDVAFLALDEAQLAADFDRGHVFTERLLNRRGREETLIVGASTLKPALEQLLPGVTIATRPRLSCLAFSGDRKISRLPRRSAIVAFSAEEVYAIAEFIRRQNGGAAVVLGALSPRTRNAQVALYQGGEVDYIVATDAIGMGLNLDIDHVAFASDKKFDGWRHRRLTPSEFGQIAGRAGRNQRDGTFGTTGRCPPFDPKLAADIEDHVFDPIGQLQWRNSVLDFASIKSLQASLEILPCEPRLARAPIREDAIVLEMAAKDEFVQKQIKTRADVQRLWDVCQIPDYRKISLSAHADLALGLFRFVVRAGKIPDEWFDRQLAAANRTDGDIDAISARIAHIRTFNFIANRPDWLRDPEHWQGVTRQVEDNLSDALHLRLASRFVDRRTSVLMRRLKENGMLESEITGAGDVLVEGQHVGTLHGFRFTPDPRAEGEVARTLSAAAMRVLATEIDGRALRVSEAVDSAFVLANDGTIRWLGEAVAKISGGDRLLAPGVRVLADEQLTGGSLEMVQRRLDLWMAQHVRKLLGPLFELESGQGLEGVTRGVAFQLAEALGVLERGKIAQVVRSLSQDDRAALRKLGVRFGAYHLYLPSLLKPAPRALASVLWALKQSDRDLAKGLDEVPHLASSGRTSFPASPEVAADFYRAAGFRVCGERAVRVDIIERLADIIRPAVAFKPGVTPGEPPSGAADGDSFTVTVAMTSLAGCAGEAFGSVLLSLGYVSERRPGPAITAPLIPAAPTVPLGHSRGDNDAGHPEEIAEEQVDASTPARMDSFSSEAGEQDNALACPETTDATGPDPETITPPLSAAPSCALDEATYLELSENTQCGPELAAGAAEPLIEIWRPKPRNPTGRRRRQSNNSASANPNAGMSNRNNGVRRMQPANGEGKKQENRGAAPVEQAQPIDAEFKQGKPPRHEKWGKKQKRSDSFSEKPRRERAPDPDSPFAKLLSLKAELEAKARKD